MKWSLPSSLLCLGLIAGCSDHPSKIGAVKEEAPTAAAGSTVRPDRPAAKVYALTCKTCHGEDGMGDRTSGYPPLAGSEWLNGDPEVPIRIVLNGLAGEMEVNGEKFGETAMTPQAPMFYSDTEFASVLTYARSQWGNTGSEITADQIAAVKTVYLGKGTENPADLKKQYGIGAELGAPDDEGADDGAEAPDQEGTEATDQQEDGTEDPGEPDEGTPD
jgi:mono/diheme cytochrome c family protein